MRKIDWMSKIYVFICEEYIKRKPEEGAKEVLEKILFLMQYDSLQYGKKPFLPYKVYIDGDSIRIRYISDLLRVTRAMSNFWIGGGKSLLSWRSIDTMYKYIKLSRKYKRLSIEKIEERATKILENEKLNSKYFVYGKYEDKFMRRIARLWSYQSDHYFMNLVWWCWTMMVGVFLILMVITPFLSKEIIDFSMLYVILIIVTITNNGLWLLWTKKITGPTQFEIDHDYVDK